MFLIALAIVALPQESEDRVYTNADLKIRLKVPKGWTLKKGEDESTLATFQKGNSFGQLTHVKVEEVKLEDFANLVEEQIKGSFQEMKRHKSETRKKEPGEWLYREYTMKTDDVQLRYAMLFVRRDANFIQILLPTPEAEWEKNKDEIADIVNGLEFTDAKKEEKPTAYRYHPWEAWNAFGEKSWVRYDVKAYGQSGEIVKRLAAKYEKNVEILTQLRNLGSGGEEKESIRKDGTTTGIDPIGWCKGCNGPRVVHFDPASLKVESLKIGDKEVRCHYWNAGIVDCKGEGTLPLEVWFSPEVPGHIVKLVNPDQTRIATAFEAKEGGGASKPAPSFEFDWWKSWDSFAVGSTVTYQMPGDMRIRKTIKSKSDKEIVLTSVALMKKGDEWSELSSNEEKIIKPSEPPRFNLPEKCGQCQKPFADHKKPEIQTGKAKLGEQEINTHTFILFNCEGKEVMKSVYSTDVPGWLLDIGTMKVLEFKVAK